MTETYDELELLPKVTPSARHANRTLCCEVIHFRGTAGDGFCRGLKGGNVFVYSRGMDIPLASGAYTIGKSAASEIAEIRSLVEEHRLLTHSKESDAVLSGWNESDCGFVHVSAAV